MNKYSREKRFKYLKPIGSGGNGCVNLVEDLHDKNYKKYIYALKLPYLKTHNQWR